MLRILVIVGHIYFLARDAVAFLLVDEQHQITQLVAVMTIGGQGASE